MVPPIVHYSAPEPFTKYEMCLVFARILGVPHAHIVADAEPPKVRPGEAARGPWCATAGVAIADQMLTF